ncbi:hypothetical protein GCM10007423_49410 [Dyadobacter endophyticus]|uniref:Uncharacterized protein n=1 Tax=Dyadobacter endophyticus TaxID=1749036 RepID=A0ABQ1Z3Y0_9BACT|nr:hypothetical protein GCM10007423_49410 [Dyadobacter endophyticus]
MSSVHEPRSETPRKNRTFLIFIITYFFVKYYYQLRGFRWHVNTYAIYQFLFELAKTVQKNTFSGEK